jgi:ubiquitin carboxyl-terminal hydrolase 16/45
LNSSGVANVLESPPVLVIRLIRFKVLGKARVASKESAFVRVEHEVRVESKGLPQNYRLRAVVSHSGRLQGGHYLAYVRAGEHGEDDEQWFRCDDSTVTGADIEAALSEANAFTPYLLFYERGAAA